MTRELEDKIFEPGNSAIKEQLTERGDLSYLEQLSYPDKPSNFENKVSPRRKLADCTFGLTNLKKTATGAYMNYYYYFFDHRRS